MRILRFAIAGAVTIIWTGTFGKYLVAGGASPPAELSGVFTLVVTWALGAELKDAFIERKERHDGR